MQSANFSTGKSFPKIITSSPSLAAGIAVTSTIVISIQIFPIVDVRVNTDVCPMFFNLGESEVLKYPFINAGFKDISLKKVETKLIYSSTEEACDASFLGGPVAMAYSRFDEADRKEAKAEYIKSIEPFKTENGYEIPGEFVICSGVKN